MDSGLTSMDYAVRHEQRGGDVPCSLNIDICTYYSGIGVWLVACDALRGWGTFRCSTSLDFTVNFVGFYRELIVHSTGTLNFIILTGVS